jgi:hypothetical protein
MIAHEPDAYHAISERVGWNKRDLTWPTLSEVNAAQFDAERLLTWSRFLPRAENREQQQIIGNVIRFLSPAISSEWSPSATAGWGPEMLISGA